MDSMFNTLLARALAGGSGGGGGGTGTDDYTDLNNKPKVNNVTVVGNLTSSDLKLQGEITSSHKLSADLVDDSTSTNKFNVQADWDQTTNSAPDYIKNKPTLGTAAATDATAYATAAQGTKADSAIQTVNVNGTALTPTSAKAVNITVPTQASDINALPNTTKYAAALSLTIDSSTYVMTGQLKDQNGDNLGKAQPIDLPLESVVVGGSYDSQTQKVILTLQNGNTIEFSVADLVSGLQTELSATNKLDPSFINYDTTHAAVTESDKTTWSGKQDALTFDGTYSASTNKAATVSTVTNAVNALDVTGDASVSASKTISAWSETDGKVSISTQDIAIAGTQTTLTGYAKSGTAGQAVAATDNVNQAIGKLEATVDNNKNNISNNTAEINGQQNATTDTVAGRGYAIINGKRLYMTDSQPTDGRQGDKWIDGNSIKSYDRTDNMINPATVMYGYYINANGEIVQSGAATAEQKLNLTEEFTITEAKYTLSGKNIVGNNTSVAFCWFNSSHEFLERTTLNVNSISNYSLTAEPVQDAVYMRINYVSADGKPMLNTGDTALPYEPYLQWE